MLKRTKTKDIGALRTLMTGLLVATLTFFACMLIVTLMLYLGNDPTYKSEFWSFGAMLLAGALAGFINAKRCGGGVLIATLSALMLVLIIFLIGVVTMGVPSLPSIVNYLLYIGISASIAYLCSREPKRKHRR